MASVLIKVSRGPEPVEYTQIGRDLSVYQISSHSVGSPTMATCMLESHSRTVHEAGHGTDSLEDSWRAVGLQSKEPGLRCSSVHDR